MQEAHLTEFVQRAILRGAVPAPQWSSWGFDGSSNDRGDNAALQTITMRDFAATGSRAASDYDDGVSRAAHRLHPCVVE